MKPYPYALAFLDVETTGLSAAGGDRVCEIAVVRSDPQGETLTWQSLVNPERPIAPGAAAVNGITDEMVAGAPRFEAVSSRVLELIEDAVIVCHNAPFDLSFLEVECGRCGMPVPERPVIDTLRLARSHFSFPSNSLGNVARSLGIALEGQHRALADALTTREVFSRFWSMLSDRVEKPEDLFFRRPAPGAAFPGEQLNPLFEAAIRANRAVELRYASGWGSETRRIVRPLEIFRSYDAAYLVAFCLLRHEKRTFRLDRIREARAR